MNKVLVITVTYNGMKWIENCLRSVSLSSTHADIMVIDNCSADGTAEFIRSNFPDVELIESKSNLGFGQGNNIALGKALERGYDYVYLLNQDAYLEKDTLGEMLATFELSKSMKERFGILSPMQKNEINGPLDKKFARWLRRSKVRSESGIHEMRFVNAAHWMICRECLEEVGGFSPVFSQYGEDNNYIHRARYFGWKAGAVEKAEAIHDRDCTKISPEKRLRIKTITRIVKLSNPSGSLILRKITQPLALLGLGIYFRSSYPFRFIPQMIKRYPEISLRRKESQKKSAFLNYFS